MKRKMLSGKDLIKLGYPEGKAVGLAINTVLKYFRRSEKEEIFAMLNAVLANPKTFVENSIWTNVAHALLPSEKRLRTYDLLKNRIEYPIYGAGGIEEGARNQMEIAMKLPITLGGALMPDAHQGYGLPIGGVLATKNAVIPYGVGVDIGCRMCLTVYPLNETFLDRHRSNLKQILLDNPALVAKHFRDPRNMKCLTGKCLMK
jgi:tRNA-splicing ligase RtcB (3'-phosphate/5'-hydroxy nucleic acid ligase)